MPSTLSHACSAILLSTVIAGCAQDVARQVQSTPVDPIVPATAAPIVQTDVVTPRPIQFAVNDQPETPTIQVINLTLWQMQLPDGGVSQSVEFWKRINEPVVDVDTNSLLLKNGIRVGMGSSADWPRFKAVLEARGARMLVKNYYTAHNTKDQTLWMSGNLPDQTLFFYDKHGLSGRVYDGCHNKFTIAFEPAPRKNNTVRIELCPGVQSLRKHFQVNGLNEEEVIDYVATENLYDLNLRVDIPPGSFLVVAPSLDARRLDSIGHQFLTADATASRRENLLLFFSDARPDYDQSPPATAPSLH